MISKNLILHNSLILGLATSSPNGSFADFHLFALFTIFFFVLHLHLLAVLHYHLSQVASPISKTWVARCALLPRVILCTSLSYDLVHVICCMLPLAFDCCMLLSSRACHMFSLSRRMLPPPRAQHIISSHLLVHACSSHTNNTVTKATGPIRVSKGI